jgi:hypothetical protein
MVNPDETGAYDQKQHLDLLQTDQKLEQKSHATAK